jgi:alkanesulfonate monooxygenase SsuD/methylene tetrahydromethanopterin reductase-like flavin-dependent oxidoreductase (luciferase family)
MHVGMTTFFQNIGRSISDYEVYRHEISMADLAEPLGFDSIWGAEHHFDDYTMCPNVAQFLTYMAARTKHVKLGSMVMVLPWHNPVRLVEEVSVLDNLSDGRVILGIGRGLGRIEFRGFGAAMSESRARFSEYAQAIMQGLETGFIEHAGEFYNQPRIAIGAGAHSLLSRPHLCRIRIAGVTGDPVPAWPRTVDHRAKTLGDHGGRTAPIARGSWR